MVKNSDKAMNSGQGSIKTHMLRSQVGGAGNNNNKVNEGSTSGSSNLDIILGKIQELSADVKEIRKECISTKEALQELHAVKSHLQQRSIKWDTELEMLRKKVHEMEKKGETRERLEKSTNITIRGWEPGEFTVQECEKMLALKLGVHDEVEDVKLVKRERQVILVVAKMKSKTGKINVMENKNKLRGSCIYIGADRTFKEREIQRKIQGIAYEHREKGEDAKVGFRELVVNNKRYTWNDEKDGLVETVQRERNYKPPGSPGTSRQGGRRHANGRTGNRDSGSSGGRADEQEYNGTRSVSSEEVGRREDEFIDGRHDARSDLGATAGQ